MGFTIHKSFRDRISWKCKGERFNHFNNKVVEVVALTISTGAIATVLYKDRKMKPKQSEGEIQFILEDEYQKSNSGYYREDKLKFQRYC